jgi:hypothetical protein
MRGRRGRGRVKCVRASLSRRTGRVNEIDIAVMEYSCVSVRSASSCGHRLR